MVSNIPPAVIGVFTLPPYDQAPPKLIGGFCKSCNQYYFPQPRFCKSCLEPVEGMVLDSEGTIYSFAVVRRKPPLGFPNPYGVGFVDLRICGLRIFCLFDPASVEQLKIGLPVTLAVASLGHDGHGSPRLRPYFTPICDNSKREI